MSNAIIYEVQNGIGILRVNRPEARNALDTAARTAFAQVIETAAANTQLRVLIITGTGSAFVAGGDIRELAERPSKEAGLQLSRLMQDALAQLTTLPCPVIGAVNGTAAGGGVEILSACDLRIAKADANLRFVQVRMGLTSGWGGTARLVRLLGQSRATDLILNGQVISAAEAHEFGFIHRLVPPKGDVLAAAQEWAEELITLPQHALAALKALIHHAPQESLTDAYQRENRHFLELYGEADNREAINAFMEKRPPHFS